MSKHKREPYFWSWPMIIFLPILLASIGYYLSAVVTDLTTHVSKPGPVATAPYRPIPLPAPQRPAQPHPAPTYTVKEGDNLWKIARTVTSSFAKSTTTASPSSRSKPTKTASSSTATPAWVHSAIGNSTSFKPVSILFKIVQQIERLNPQIKNPNLIYPGQILKL